MAPSRRLLIDGDVLCHRFGAKHTNTVELDGEDVEFCPKDTLLADVSQFIKNLKEALEGDAISVLLSVPTEEGFRRGINPTYKSNRAGFKKPIGHPIVQQYLLEEWDATMIPKLEADDCIGIMMTNPDCWEERIACSIDKDFLSVPGKFYNWNHQELIETNELQADFNFMVQTLAGDPVDGYKGIPRIGPKRAQEILVKEGEEIPLLEELWERTQAAYDSKGLTYEDALLNARMARILRFDDYDRINKEPILWDPLGTW